MSARIEAALSTGAAEEALRGVPALGAALSAVTAAVATFRFKVGIMHRLLACSLAGVVLQLVFGNAL